MRDHRRPAHTPDREPMPTYEYACPTCGIVEQFQSIKDAPLKKCPQCRIAKVTRLFSGGGGVIFKGSGFWETDYNRSADYSTRAGAESGSVDNPTPATRTATAAKKADAPAAAKATTPAATGTAKGPVAKA